MNDQANPIFHIRLLGEFSLEYGGTLLTGVRTLRLQSLLAYLLLHRDAPQSRAHLAFQFWPDSTDAQARSNLRTLLHRLRRALPGDTPFLDVDAQTVQWHPGAPATVDVASFEQALAQADEVQGVQQETAAIQALEQAATLYQGDLLPSCYDDWILPHRERLRQAHLRALERLIQLLEDRRDFDAAIAHAQRILRLDPLHEAATRRLMHLYSLKGDRTGALRAFHTCATTLQRELGVEPSPATQRAYEGLLKTDAQPVPAPSLATGLTPLVGREEAWAQLQAAWRSAARGPRLVLILGEAGIGKTRLVEELLHWAAQQGIDRAYARCYAAEGDLAYAPVTALLRARRMPALDEVWLAEVARLLPEVRAGHPDLPPTRPITEGWQRQRLYEALVQAVLPGSQPLLLVIDDLQWCSRESLEWLHFLLRFDQKAPLLVVGTCRPEELDQDCPLTSALPTLHRDVRLTELELGPLDKAQTVALADSVFGATLEAIESQRLYQETEGNPLFIVESLRAGLSSKKVLPGLDGAHLPPRVQAVLATRLAQLSDPARQLAEIAATIGRGFTVPLLQQAADTDEESLALGLDELWRRRIVRERDLDAYDFNHDKLREAAYSSLSPARRRLLHHRTAQALESIHASDLDPVSRQVAAHYRRAGLPAQAIPFYLRAGQAASRIYAQQEAIAAFQRGLDLLQRGSWDASQSAWRSQMAAQGHEGLGDVLAQLGPEEARAAYQAALQELPQENLPARARLHRKIGRTWWPQGEYDKAMQAVRRALSTLGSEPSTPDAEWWSEWASVQALRAEVCYSSARVEELEDTIEEMQRAIEHLTTPAQQFRLSWAIGAARLRRGRYVVSDWFITAEKPAMVARIRQSGDSEATAFVLYMLGWVTLLYGDLDEAEQDMQEALALAERTRHLVYRTWILTWLSVLHRKRGEAEATREYALRGLQVATSAGLLENAALVRGNLAWLAWREGDLAEAEKQARTALELWDQSAFVYAFHWTALFPLLVMAVERDALAEALEHAQALLHPQQRRLPESLEAALEAAIQVGDDGQVETARQRLERVIQVAQETGYL